MSYTIVNVDLSDTQKRSLVKAHRNHEGTKIRLSYDKLGGSDGLTVTKTQYNKIEKAKAEGKGIDLSLSNAQIKRHFTKQGGAIPPGLLEAVGGVGEAMQGTYQKMMDNISKQRQREFEKNQMTGWYDRKKARNDRFVQRKNDKQLAKRFSYVKNEYVKERGLPWNDEQIWAYVLAGGGMNHFGAGTNLPDSLKGKKITPAMLKRLEEQTPISRDRMILKGPSSLKGRIPKTGGPYIMDGEGLRQRLNDRQLAKRFNYVKKEFVKERNLPWSDNQVWQYVLSGSGMNQGGNLPPVSMLRKQLGMQKNAHSTTDVSDAPHPLKGEGMRLWGTGVGCKCGSRKSGTGIGNVVVDMNNKTPVRDLREGKHVREIIGRGLKKKKQKFHPLSNFEIEDMMKNEKGWFGVVTRDTLYDPPRAHDLRVINYDDMEGQGTHWVATFNHPDQDMIFFYDSYGLVPGDEIQTFLKKSNKEIMYNTSEMQDTSSIMCGWYCVYFLKECNKGRNPQDIIYEFDNTPTKENERKIREIATGIINE